MAARVFIQSKFATRIRRTMNKERPALRSRRRKQLTRPGQLFIDARMYDWRKYWRRGRRAATVIQQFFHLSCRAPHSALFIHLCRRWQSCERVNYCISVAGRWHDNGCFNWRMNMTTFFTAAFARSQRHGCVSTKPLDAYAARDTAMHSPD
jgi:hypothetical protein